MTAKDLIELLQTMNPELPIQIRMNRSEPQKSEKYFKTAELRTIKPSPLQYSLKSTDILIGTPGNLS